MRLGESDGLAYWLLLAGAALGVRLAVVFGVLPAMPLFSDAVLYAADAGALLDDFPGDEAYYLPPGLPYLTALAYVLFGQTLATARLLSIGVSVLGVLMIAWLAHLVLRHRRAARWAGSLAAVYPPDVMMNGQLYTQPLEMLCLLAMTCCLIEGYRRRRWALFGCAGLAFGFGSLTRPSLLSLTLLLLPTAWVLLRRARRQDAAGATRGLLDGSLAFCVGVLVCVLPVMQHNAAHGAGPRLSTNNRWHFFLGNNPYTPHYKTSYLSSRPVEQFDPEVRAYLRRFGARDDPGNTMQQEAWRYVVRHPFVTLLRTLNRARAFWGFDYVTARRIQTFYGLDARRLAGLLLLEAGGYALVMTLALLGLFCGGPLLAREHRWLLWLVAAYQLPYVAAFATGAYHFSAMGLLMPLAGAGLWVLKDRSLWRRDGRGRRRFYLALALFGAIQLEYAWFTLAYSTVALG